MTNTPKHPGGRPLKFKTVKELEKKIKEYFDSCFNFDKTKQKGSKKIIIVKRRIRPFTITGLAVALDTSRETLINYQNKEQYFDAITRAKHIIHNFAEESLWEKGVGQGIIFNLKNNYGWKDRTEVEGNMNHTGSIVYLPPKKK